LGCSKTQSSPASAGAAYATAVDRALVGPAAPASALAGSLQYALPETLPNPTVKTLHKNIVSLSLPY